jgi:hypothetical protein
MGGHPIRLFVPRPVSNLDSDIALSPPVDATKVGMNTIDRFWGDSMAIVRALRCAGISSLGKPLRIFS